MSGIATGAVRLARRSSSRRGLALVYHRIADVGGNQERELLRRSPLGPSSGKFAISGRIISWLPRPGSRLLHGVGAAASHSPWRSRSTMTTPRIGKPRCHRSCAAGYPPRSSSAAPLFSTGRSPSGGRCCSRPPIAGIPLESAPGKPRRVILDHPVRGRSGHYRQWVPRGTEDSGRAALKLRLGTGQRREAEYPPMMSEALVEAGF